MLLKIECVIDITIWLWVKEWQFVFCLFGGFVFKNITIVFVIIEIKHGEKIITNKGMLI